MAPIFKCSLKKGNHEKLFLLCFFIFLINATNAQKWQYLNPKPTGNPIWTICYTDADTWYAAGSLGTMLKTIDGGVIWTTLNLDYGTDIGNVHFINANTGYASGGNMVFKTIDAGETWT